MKANGLDGDLCLDLRKISTWSESASRKIAELKKKNTTIPHKLLVVNSVRWYGKYSEQSKKFYGQIVRQLVSLAEREKWPTIRLMVSEEVAGTHSYRRIIYETFMPVLKKIAPEKMIMIDNSIGFGRKKEIDVGERDNVPVRQYNSWTKKAIADAKRSGAEVRGYNYGMFRASWGFEQQRLNSTGYHQWADQWGRGWIYSRVSPDGNITSSVQYERIREGRFDYLYCNTFKYYIQRLKQKGMPKRAKKIEQEFRGLLNDMPTERPGFFVWNTFHNWNYLDKMKLFVIVKINEIRTLLGERSYRFAKGTSGTPEFIACESVRGKHNQKNDRKQKLILRAPYLADDTVQAAIDGLLKSGSLTRPDNSTGPLNWMREDETNMIAAAGGNERIKQPLRSSVSVVYDAKGVYFAIKCNGRSSARYLKVGRTQGDNTSDLWLDDCVEIFMNDPNNHNSFHIMVNAEGHKVLLRNGKMIRADTIKVSTRPTDKGYSQEMFIPWQYFGLAWPPAAGTVWPMNIGREFHTKNQITSWGRVRSQYREAKHWGGIEFTGTSPNMKVILNTQPLYPGRNVIEGIIASPQKKHPEDITFKLTNQSGQILKPCRPVLLTKGHFKIFLTIPESQANNILTLTVQNKDGRQLGLLQFPVYSRQKSIVITQCPKIAASGETLKLDITICLGNAEAEHHTLQGCFISDNGEILSLKSLPLKSNSNNILRIGTAGLEPGKWNLQLWISGLGSTKNNTRREMTILPLF